MRFGTGCQALPQTDEPASSNSAVLADAVHSSLETLLIRAAFEMRQTVRPTLPVFSGPARYDTKIQTVCIDAGLYSDFTTRGKEMRQHLVLKYLALTLCTVFARAEEATYDQATHTLHVPTLVVGNTRYNDLVVKVDSVTLVSASSQSKASGPGAAPAICTMNLLTEAKLDQIKLGMSLEQVNQILGCQYSVRQANGSNPGAPSSYYYIWQAVWKSIAVTYLPNNDAAIPVDGADSFKWGISLNW